MHRNEAIAQIRAALQKRSGKSWSVKGGRGTAYGWIDISSPPQRRIEHGYMSEEDRAELGHLLIPLDTSRFGGQDIARRIRRGALSHAGRRAGPLREPGTAAGNGSCAYLRPSGRLFGFGNAARSQTTEVSPMTDGQRFLFRLWLSRLLSPFRRRRP